MSVDSADDNAILDRAKKAVGVKSDSSFAQLIGISPQDLSNRKKRGTLRSLIIEWALKEDLNVSFILSDGKDQPQIEQKKEYELDQDLMTMIFECFDKYEEENGKISAIDKTRIASSIFRELDGHNTTLNEIERSIRMLIDYNR